MKLDRVPRIPIVELIRIRVEQALADHHGNRTQAAIELGVSVRTVQRWLKAVESGDHKRRINRTS